jgi:hypothetical protein
MGGACSQPNARFFRVSRGGGAAYFDAAGRPFLLRAREPPRSSLLALTSELTRVRRRAASARAGSIDAQRVRERGGGCSRPRDGRSPCLRPAQAARPRIADSPVSMPVPVPVPEGAQRSRVSCRYGIRVRLHDSIAYTELRSFRQPTCFHSRSQSCKRTTVDIPRISPGAHPLTMERRVPSLPFGHGHVGLGDTTPTRCS